MIIINKLAISLILLFILFSLGCTSVDQSGVAQQSSQMQSSQTGFSFVPESQEYSCFKITGVSETYRSDGWFGKDIADIRVISGTIQNNCGKIKDVYLNVQWFDEKGHPTYADYLPINFFRLKPGESRDFKAQGFHVDASDIRTYGYLEETKGWSYKIGLGSNRERILAILTNSP